MEADIATVLNYKDWKQVATHNADGEYGHHHHQMTHQLVKKPIKRQTAMLISILLESIM